MAALPKACIIGAGSSGLTTCKALQERAVPFDCFELSDDIGGNWYYDNPNGLSSIYRQLHIDTSKSRMQFSDFPMPEEYPNYASHEQVFQYFSDYADHFGLRRRITFNTGVEQARLGEDGLWQVTLSTGERRLFDALFVCNGHHWDPRWPEPPFPGEFHGEAMHSHYFRTAEPFRDQRVVVVGMGNSALDIAVETSYVAKETFLAARRGVYIIPKYLFGKPLDTWWPPRTPYWVDSFLLGILLRLQVGRMEDYGLPRPDHKLLEAHPSMSSTALDRIAHREITPKPNIARLLGDRVEFTDGSVEKVDVIVYATGYKVSFPFFDADFLAAPKNELPLYLRMIKPGLPNLFFIGLVQPLGAIFPIAERQAIIAGEYLCGRYAPPPEPDMLADIARREEMLRRRYVRSPRHTMQVDFDGFMRLLKKELRTGARRARAVSNCRPLPPRAGTLATGC